MAFSYHPGSDSAAGWLRSEECHDTSIKKPKSQKSNMIFKKERCLFPLPSGHDMQTVVNLIIDKNYNINVFIYCWLLLSLLLTGACPLVASDLYVTLFVSYVRSRLHADIQDKINKQTPHDIFCCKNSAQHSTASLDRPVPEQF